MTAMRILKGLESSPATGAEADVVARLGFLEWAFGLQDIAAPKAAKDALASPEAQAADSDAARAFVGFLQDATRPVSRGVTRRKGRRAVH